MESQFDDLPGEVLERTLCYFNKADRQQFRLISKLWNKTITTLYGVTLRVNNINLDESLACKSFPIMGYFQSLTLLVPMDETGTDFLSRLTSLTFTGVIVCYNIFPVFEQCQQIQKLEFIKCIVNQKTREHHVHLEDPSKLLPSLRSLVIKLRYSPFNSSEINFFTRLLPFFTCESGKLDSIVLDCPFSFGEPLRTTFAKIFQRKSIAMNNADVVSEPWLDEDKIADKFYTTIILKNVRTLRNLEMVDGDYCCTFKMKFCIKNEEKDFLNVQFSEFEQVLYRVGRNIDHRIPNLLRPQTHLTKLTVEVSRKSLPINQIYSIANRNAKTLKSLIITYTKYQECLDAFSLTQLCVLQNLQYSCLMTPRFQTLNYTLLENFNYLPSSLRTLSTTATIQFENEDDFNMAAFQRLDKLETLELLVMPFFEIGKTAIYEMGPQRIRQIISWLPSLKKLVLRNVLNTNATLITRYINYYVSLPPQTDPLPDKATDWMKDERGISFQKYPIVIESHTSNENSALVGQRGGWESDHYPNHQYLEFPVHFDGVIRIQPDFRRNTTQSI